MNRALPALVLGFFVSMSASRAMTPRAMSQDWMSAAAVLSAASCPEELSQGEFERFYSLNRHPVDINSASRRKLLGCGLFSSYQVEVLLDYIARCGPIVSYTELASLDGFSLETARSLQYFTVLEVTSCHSSRNGTRFSGLVRYSSPSNVISGKCKYEGDLGLGASVAYRNSLDNLSYIPAGWSLSYEGSHFAVTAGDFCARFGEGLALWSGFSLSGVSTPEAILRSSAGGISQTNSFSGDSHFRGLSASFDLSRWTLSALWNADPSMFAVNASRYTLSGTYGLTGLIGPGIVRTGAHFRFTHGSISWSGEAVVDRYSSAAFSYAAIVALQWNIAYRKTFSAALRCYPVTFSAEYSLPLRSSTKASDELGVCAALRLRDFFITSDLAFHPAKGEGVYLPFQYKTICQYTLDRSFKDRELEWKIKAVVRYRNYEQCPLRSEIRSDLSVEHNGFSIGTRADYVHSFRDSFHFMLSAGCKNAGKWGMYARASVFRVDNWADRIYVYERDVPSYFSVPAYYGRGIALGGLLNYRQLYLSLSYKHYLDGDDHADGLKCTLQLSF